VSVTATAHGAVLQRDAKRLGEALGLSGREARAEAELLLIRALNITRARLIAHPELAVEAATNSTYRKSIERRLRGEPVAYILGEREFYGHVFSVSPDVLIPRVETELLVDLALERLDPQQHERVLDLGTGSGAVAIAIALNRPNVDVTVVDVSAGCLEVAHANARRLLGDAYDKQLHLLRGDWFGAVGQTQFGLIVSNPPYVAHNDIHLSRGDIRFEPQQALVSGPEGLNALAHIIATAPGYLANGGWLLCEHGYNQADAVRRLLIQAGFSELVSEHDLAGIPRVSGGRWLTGTAGGG
jgi:release factor glutamine methyltransferase